jgi:hypothetical protein
MRWTDLPADSGAADAGVSGLGRSEWQQLRQRLERLPAGHPSAPDDDGPPAEEPDEDGSQGEALDGDPGSAEAADGHDRDGGRPADPGRGERSARPARPHGSSRPGGGDTQAAGALGRAEPYRPWFASGDSAEPWFATDGQ